MQYKQVIASDLEEYQKSIMDLLLMLSDCFKNIPVQNDVIPSQFVLKRIGFMNRKISKIKEVLKSLVRYSKYLEEYGNKSFQESKKVKKELIGLTRKFERTESEVESLRSIKKTYQIQIDKLEQEINIIRCLNKLDVSCSESFVFEISENPKQEFYGNTHKNKDQKLLQSKNQETSNILDQSSSQMLHCLSEYPSLSELLENFEEFQGEFQMLSEKNKKILQSTYQPNF